MLIYLYSPYVFGLMVFVLLWGVSHFSYRLGWRLRPLSERGAPYFMPDFVPTAIQATLALILGFTFSMAIARFEARRQLVIEESNEISSTYMHAQALRHGSEEVASLLRGYLDARVGYYELRPKSEQADEAEERARGIERQLWDVAYRVSKKDRGAIESHFLQQLNRLSDIRNERNIALSYTLPRAIYGVLLLLSIAAVAAVSFARAGNGERGQWQHLVLIAVTSMVLGLILDIDQPTMGSIRISQDAMLALQKQLGVSVSARAYPSEAAGRAESSR